LRSTFFVGPSPSEWSLLTAEYYVGGAFY